MAGTTELSNTVTLDGVSYAVRDVVRQQPASEFQAGLRLGSPQHDDRLGAFILGLEDTSGGFGILNADERQNQHQRPRFATSETRFPRHHGLGPLVTSVTLTGVTFPSGIPQGKMVQWGDVLIIGVGTKIFKLNSALALSDITPAITGEHADLISHEFNDGFFASNPALLWGLKSTTAGNTTQYWIAAAADPGVGDWSDQGSVTTPEELVSMVSYNQRILKIQGTIMKESNQGTCDDSPGINTWGDLATSPFTATTFMDVPRHSTFIGTHMVPFSPDFMPYLILGGSGGYQGKVAMLDYWARQLKPLELNIGRISSGFMLDDGIVLSTTYDLFKLIPSDPPVITPLSLRKEQGFDDQMSGALVSGLGAVNGQLVCGLTNLKSGVAGRIWIMQHNGAGWHCRAQQSLSNAIVLDLFNYERPASLYGWRSNAYLCWITWTGSACQLHYIKEPIGSGNPEQDTTYEYATSGVEETPWMYGGFEDLYGALLRIRARGHLTASETVEVSYKLNDDDSAGWTSLGTFNNSVQELSWGTNGVGIRFKSVRFKFTYARGGTVTNTPLVRTFIILYDKKPLTRRSYIFTVDAARMISEQKQADTDPWSSFTSAVDFKEILDKLVTAKDIYTLLAFTYDNEPTRYVKILALPSTEQELHDSMRRGSIQVQVTEVLNSTLDTG